MKFAFSTIATLLSALAVCAAPAPPGTTKTNSNTRDPITGDRSHTTTYTAPQYNSVTKFGSTTYIAFVPDCSLPTPPTTSSAYAYTQIPILFSGKYTYSYTTTTFASGLPQLNRTSFSMRMSGYATTSTTRAKKGDKYTGSEALQLQFNFQDGAPAQLGYGNYEESFRTVNVLYNKQGLKNYFMANIDVKFQDGDLTPIVADTRWFQCPTAEEARQIAANPPDAPTQQPDYQQ